MSLRSVGILIAGFFLPSLLIAADSRDTDVITRAQASIQATAYVEPLLGLVEVIDTPEALNPVPGKPLYWLYHPNREGAQITIEGYAQPTELELLREHDLVSLVALSTTECRGQVTVTVVYTNN